MRLEFIRRFRFSPEQTKVVSGIFANLGHIFFASVAIPLLISPTGSGSTWFVLFGIFAAIGFWVASLAIIKNI